MEFFRDAQVVNLRSTWQELPTGPYRSSYLNKAAREKSVEVCDDEKPDPSRRQGENLCACWFVEFVDNSDSVLRLKSCSGEYLTASHEPSPPGIPGCHVFLSRDPLPYSEWKPVMVRTGVKSNPLDSEWEHGCAESEPVMERTHVKSPPPVLYSEKETVMLEHTHFERIHAKTPPPVLSIMAKPTHSERTPVKLQTRYGSFLCNRRGSVTHDLPHDITFLWDVGVVRGKERSATNIDDKASEGGSATDTATNIDNKASEEGSASNIDDKASSATKRRYEMGEGSPVTKTPSGDSGLIREGDWFRYRHHFWKLKRRLLDNSGSNDLLVRGGSGTTALVREVCADLQEHFGTIAWITIPQDNNSALLHEEILVQLIFERVAFHENFDGNPWMLKDHEFSLQQKARCLIVVDNLDNPKTWKKFEEILLMVKTCRVIFIAGRNKDSSSRQIEQHGRKFKTYDLEDPSYLPTGHYLKNFQEKDFFSKSKGVYPLIVNKCQRLPTAIVFVLRNHKERRQYCSSYTIKDEWKARIPSDNLADEFQVIQQVLEARYESLYTDQGHDLDELNPIQQVSNILFDDYRAFCLSYLGIFPENRLLSCKTVSLSWVAEGFLPDVGRAETFLKDLLMRKCIIPEEKRSDGRLSTFRVDECVRKIIVPLSDLGDPVTITSRGSTKWPRRVRYLSIHGTIWALNEEKFYKLSSIFMPDVSSNEDKSTTFEASPWEDLKHSKVLDLTGASFQIVPDELFKLTNARYLSLRNTSTKVIPSSIKKHTRLEFLDAKHSLVTKLPRQAARLEKIRKILIYHHERDPLMESYSLIGFKALCRIGGFKDLEKLCFVEADERTLKDLGNLTKLRRLGITKLRKEHGESLRTSLGKLKDLESLNLHAFDEDEILDLHYRTSSAKSKSQTPPLQSLKHLYLHGRLEKLPDWISSLNELTKIILRWSQLEEDQLEVDLLATLGNLPMLEELELRRAYDGEQLDFKEGQFPKLKILLLEELEGLRSMSLEKGTLKHLKNLTISRCQWLERIPSGVEHIQIQKLTFFDMSHEFYEKVRADAEKEGYKKLEHIQEVYFRRWRAGHWEPHHEESTDEAHCSHQVESIGGIRLEEIYLFK